jgi:hypothetical protein
VAQTIIEGDSYLSNPSRALTARRTKLRKALMDTAQMGELEMLCAAALGTTAIMADDSNCLIEGDDFSC